MKHRLIKSYLPDISAILYLALARKEHTNIYRFTMTLTEEVDPVLLQQAVENITPRFPMILAGFKPSFFGDMLIPYDKTVQVQKDTATLSMMSKEEIEECAFRVLYKENKLSIECFHAITDGFGAVAIISTLTAEYLKLRHKLNIPDGYPILNIEDEIEEAEEVDEYLVHAGDEAAKLKSFYAYQLPRESKNDWKVLTYEKTLSAEALRRASRHYEVTATSLLSAVMSEAIMKIQEKHQKRKQAVRIMIPISMRRLFPSKTLRNFIEYVNVTMPAEDHGISLKKLAEKLQNELKSQMNQKHMASIMRTHVKTQRALLVRIIPRAIKYTALRIGYSFFGESNSSITFTNLGDVKLPKVMHPYIQKIDCYLSPRAKSPYNCAMIAYNGKISMNFSRFNKNTELEELFFNRLNEVFASVEASV